MLFKSFSKIALILLTTPCLPVLCSAESDPCLIVNNAFDIAVKIRKLSKKSDVPCKVHSKSEIKNYLLKIIEKELPPSKIENEEFIFKKIGMIPGKFNYKKELINLYLGQIGGYYDPENKYYVMADWLPESIQTSISVHELTHSLQDQHFDLKKFIDQKLENSDLQLARSALVEGDASAVMLDYSRSLLKQGNIATENNVEAYMQNNMPVGRNEKDSEIKKLLIFPYTYGLKFAHYLLRKNGYSALNKAFHTPPSTTEEIMHPQKYRNGRSEFKTFTIEDLALLAGSKKENIIYKDTLGEFAIKTLLEHFKVSELRADEAAKGWGGDLVGISKDDDGNLSLIWKTNWDSKKEATEFFETYSKVLSELYPDPQSYRFTIDKTSVNLLIKHEKALINKLFG